MSRQDFYRIARENAERVCRKSVQELKDEHEEIFPNCVRTDKWDEEVDGDKDVRVSGQYSEEVGSKNQQADTVVINVGDYTIVADNATVIESPSTNLKGDVNITNNLTVRESLNVTGNLNVNGNVNVSGTLTIGGVVLTGQMLAMLGAPPGAPPPAPSE